MRFYRRSNPSPQALHQRVGESASFHYGFDLCQAKTVHDDCIPSFERATLTASIGSGAHSAQAAHTGEDHREENRGDQSSIACRQSVLSDRCIISKLAWADSRPPSCDDSRAARLHALIAPQTGPRYPVQMMREIRMYAVAKAIIGLLMHTSVHTSVILYLYLEGYSWHSLPLACPFLSARVTSSSYACTHVAFLAVILVVFLAVCYSVPCPVLF